MLCALTIPSFEALTDLGAIDPSIVFINFIELLFTVSSAMVGGATKIMEAIKLKKRNILRM
ncbi:MAG: hypothetical protein RL147_1078 [Actinomycetota bacterium]|jgi:hypothetical protein